MAADSIANRFVSRPSVAVQAMRLWRAEAEDVAAAEV